MFKKYLRRNLSSDIRVSMYLMKFFPIALILCLCNLFSLAQKIHINVLIGASNYQGDLQVKRFTFSQSGLAAGIGFSYEITDKIFLRTGATIAKVKADDKLNTKNAVRNLNFTSSIIEGHIGVEYYFMNLNEYPFSPYLFGAVAVYHFDPYTTDTAGNKFFLKPLTTEGQGFYLNRKLYNLTQFAIPFGAGVKLAVSENLRVGIEVGLRKLFTDYLDDVSTTYVDENLLLANSGTKAVELAFRGDELKNGAAYPAANSQRGGANVKDWYYFTGLTISLRLNGSSEGRYMDRKRLRSQTGCPPRVF